MDLIIDMIPAMAWSTTADGMLDFANQHFLEFIGAPLEDISGVNFYKIFHPDDMSDLASEWTTSWLSSVPKKSRAV
jgi:PAS domain-containing protein